MARAASALATHLVVLLAEEEDDKGAGGLGRPLGPPGGLQVGWQVRPGKCFCFHSFLSVFVLFNLLPLF